MREELKQELASQIKEELLEQIKSQQKAAEIKAQNEKNGMELTKQVSILEDEELQIDREETRITPAKEVFESVQKVQTQVEAYPLQIKSEPSLEQKEMIDEVILTDPPAQQQV